MVAVSNRRVYDRPTKGQGTLNGVVSSALLATLVVAVPPQAEPVVRTVRALSMSGTDSALMAGITDHPDEARELLRRLLREAAADTRSDRPPALDAAQRVAHAFAAAWHDSSLLRRVTLVRTWSAADRRRWAIADSVWTDGRDALARVGVDGAMPRFRESLRLYRTLSDSGGIGVALLAIGTAFYYAGEADSAGRYLEQALRLAEATGNPRTAANAMVALGSVVHQGGDPSRAGEWYTQALSRYRRIGDQRGMAAVHNNLGVLAEELGDTERAREAYTSALTLSRAHENRSAAAHNLLNLGNLAAREGNYDAAAAQYDEALSIYRQLDEPYHAADALRNLGLLDVRRGDYRSALQRLSHALETYERTGYTTDAIATRRSLALVHAAVGELDAALRQLGDAEATAKAHAASQHLVADLVLARGDLALQLNALSDAGDAYAGALRLYRVAGNSLGEADALEGRGVLMLLREDLSAALDACEVALRAKEMAVDPHAAARTRLLAAFAAGQLGDTAAARTWLEEALTVFHRFDDPVAQGATLAALGDLAATTGDPLRAESHYERGLRLIEHSTAPHVAWRLHAGLGSALETRGALPEAAEELRRAIAEIERVSAAVRLEERRAAYLADKWNVYTELALLERARGRHGAAFEVSERMRARQLLDLLGRGRITPPPPAGELAQREQRLRRRIDELTGRLTSEPSGDSRTLRSPDFDAVDRASLLSMLAGAQREYAALLLALRERSPDYATVVSGDAVRADDVRSALAPDEALLEYLLGDSGSVLFVATRDGIEALDLAVDRHTIARLVDLTRGTLTRAASLEGSAPWRAPLRRLYRLLVAPAEEAGLLEGKRRLVVAPHAELHYLPFAALIASNGPDAFLIERFELNYVPSASVWLGLRQRVTSPPTDRVLALAPRVSPLPGSGAEAEVIARLYGERADVVTGRSATEDILASTVARYAVVHIASSGILNKHNPLFSFVELNAGDGEDGRLEVHEVFGLDLDARLVVLSACQTALGSGALADAPAGDDWVGLVRAFLIAGASSVVGTLWAVDDRATARVVERFYQQYSSGVAPAAALARAQRASLRDSETAHPFYWAAFVTVGAP